MNDRRRIARASLPLLAIGAACMGSACSAPAPPGAVQPAPMRTDEAAAPAPPPPSAANAAATLPSSTETGAPVSEPTTAPPNTAEPVPETPPSAASIDEPGAVPPRRPMARPAVQVPEATTATPAPSGDPGASTLTVTILSRGKGVPDNTRTAYKDIRAFLEDRRDAYAITGLRTERIGLEGEQRLCVDFASTTEARAALAEIEPRLAGLDLIDAAIAPCPSPKGKSP